jgi:WD40 repeat protein
MELYEQALALWRGDAFGEFGQEWWLLAEANRLNEMRLVGMEERVEVMVTLGQNQRAIPELNWMRSSHPLRERPVALLMRAQFAAGRQADALREFQTYRAALAEDTGLEPSAELQALERSIAVGQTPAPAGGRLRSLRGYAVHAVIGEGAFGRVLAATQPGTNRDVAIKVIRPDLADDIRFVQRFEAEAQLVARLEHPHIVPLYDYWREPGGAYLVFRLLTGGTAQAALVSGGAFDVARVSRLVEEVGSALLAAHTTGVVHRDVKPANVLFDAAGNSYLTDFGIARSSSIDDEPARHDGDTVLSDIRSFGCMLWELLAGESAPSPRLPSLVDRISAPSAAIDAVIARATEPDPARRYESMADLIVAWRAAVGRIDGVLTPVEPAGAFTSSDRRRAAHALTAEISSSVNPYKGLRPFEEADADDFFGREEVALAIRDVLAVRRLVAVVGPSGSGKSSVVNAGLVPLLRDEGVRIATMVPGDQPGDSLREALRSIATAETSSPDELALIEAAVGEGATDLVLVVDQFEECWTLAATADRERFLSVLAQAVSRHVRCVVTLRADLYDRPLQDQLVGQLVADGTFALPPLNAEALQEAVVRPARRNAVEFDEGVATAIVAEASAHPAGLPLLQFALADLYERRTDHRIRADALRELGGIGGAVGRRAEETYRALAPELEVHARELFARLVAPGLGSPDTRRRARLGELSQPARDVADRFVQARLLVADRDLATREPVVEVAHEALLTNWPRLRGWLNDDREWISQMQHLAIASRNWTPSGDTEGELYRGSRLEAVLEALPERAQELNEEERAFIDASRLARDAEHERERRTNRRLRRLLTVAACLVVVVVIAGLLAYNRQQAADRSRRSAEITTLASRSEALRQSNRDSAALLAIEANRLRPDNESRAALFSTFTRDPGFLGYHVLGGDEGARVQGALVPNSDMAIVSIGFRSPSDPDSPLQVVDLTSGDLGPPFEPIAQHDYMVNVAVSADGQVAVAYGTQLDNQFYPSEALALDTATGRAIGPRLILSDNKDGQNQQFNVAVNADGTQIAVGGGTQGQVRIFDTRTGELVATIEPPDDMQASDHGRGTSTGAWAPDGTLYVGSSGTHLRQFDPLTFEMTRDVTVPTIAMGGTLQFSEDGTFLVGRGLIQRDGQTSGSVARIDLADGSVAWTIDPEEFGSFGCGVVTFSVPEDRLWCADFSGVIRGRSLSNGEPDGTTVEHQRSGLTSMAVQSVGGHRYLIAFGGYSAFIGRWQIDGAGPIARNVADGYDGAEYSPDGRWLLVFGPPPDGGPGFISAVLDTVDDRTVFTKTPDLADVEWLDDERLGAITADGHGRVIDVRTGETRDVPIDVAPGHQRIARVADGQIALGYDDGHVDVFDFDAGTRVVTLRRSNESDDSVIPVGMMAPSADGTRLYVMYDLGRGVYEFDVASGRQLQWDSDTSINSVAVAGDGPVAIGHIDGAVTLHDSDDLTVVGTLPGARSFASVGYDGDGRFLVVNGGDGTMALYDVARRQRMGDPIDIGNAGAVLRPDGMEIAVGHSDHPSVTLWSLDPKTLTGAACHIAGRNLSRTEWDTYIGDLASYHATCPEYAVPAG